MLTLKPCKHQDGMTLIELMITVAVLAILVALVVPSFVDQIQRSKIRSATADFIVAIAHARNEATTRATTIYVRPESAWGNGWCVSTSATSCAEGDSLRRFDGPKGISFSSEEGKLAFDKLGHLESSTNNTFSLCGKSTLGKKIEVLALGQSLVQDCTCNTTTKVCS